jgi:hypothetical protein
LSALPHGVLPIAGSVRRVSARVGKTRAASCRLLSQSTRVALLTTTKSRDRTLLRPAASVSPPRPSVWRISSSTAVVATRRHVHFALLLRAVRSATRAARPKAVELLSSCHAGPSAVYHRAFPACHALLLTASQQTQGTHGSVTLPGIVSRALPAAWTDLTVDGITCALLNISLRGRWSP